MQQAAEGPFQYQALKVGAGRILSSFLHSSFLPSFFPVPLRLCRTHACAWWPRWQAWPDARVFFLFSPALACLSATCLCPCPTTPPTTRRAPHRHLTATTHPRPLLPTQARIEQAEAGGCPEALVSEAKRQLHRLLLAEVKAELDAGEASGEVAVVVWGWMPAGAGRVGSCAPGLGWRLGLAPWRAGGVWRLVCWQRRQRWPGPGVLLGCWADSAMVAPCACGRASPFAF